jgi:hypothetical protein
LSGADHIIETFEHMIKFIRAETSNLLTTTVHVRTDRYVGRFLLHLVYTKWGLH